MKNKHAFWDSSALVPLCCQQSASQPLRRLLRQTTRTVVWWGALVEINSALSRLARNGDINQTNLQHAQQRLLHLQSVWSEVAPGETVRQLAKALPETYVLRAMDAFQLAAALVWCNEKPRGRFFVCDDVRLGQAAESAGFTVLP